MIGKSNPSKPSSGLSNMKYEPLGGHSGHSHTMACELDFIDHLGYHNHMNLSPIERNARRVRLLKQYLASIKLRSIWKDLDKDEIISYVKSVLYGENS